MVTVTARSGSSERVTLTVTVPPSATVYVDCSNSTSTSAGRSSSMMEITVSSVVPSVTPSGRVLPKVSFTDSSSSSMVSAVAVKVNVLEVSPELNTTFAGTPL